MVYFRSNIVRSCGSAFALVVTCAFSSVTSIPAHAQQARSSAVHLVVKDSRDIEPNSVRFAAAQGTEAYPNIALLGVNQSVWPKIRSAALQSEANGFPVRAIIVGPPSAMPALEVYAKGHHVTRPIDPNTITQAELVALIRDIHREYYSR